MPLDDVSNDGSIIATIITTRMPRNDAAAASHVGPGVRIHAIVPMLWRYRRGVGWTGESRLGRVTALVGAGYSLMADTRVSGRGW